MKDDTTMLPEYTFTDAQTAAALGQQLVARIAASCHAFLVASGAKYLVSIVDARVFVLTSKDNCLLALLTEIPPDIRASFVDREVRGKDAHKRIDAQMYDDLLALLR